VTRTTRTTTRRRGELATKKVKGAKAAAAGAVFLVRADPTVLGVAGAARATDGLIQD